jgi:hypothetical protein
MNPAMSIVLPLGRRATARRVVEGARPIRCAYDETPSTMLRVVPLPQGGRRTGASPIAILLPLRGRGTARRAVEGARPIAGARA